MAIHHIVKRHSVGLTFATLARNLIPFCSWMCLIPTLQDIWYIWTPVWKYYRFKTCSLRRHRTCFVCLLSLIRESVIIEFILLILINRITCHGKTVLRIKKNTSKWEWYLSTCQKTLTKWDWIKCLWEVKTYQDIRVLKYSCNMGISFIIGAVIATNSSSSHELIQKWAFSLQVSFISKFQILIKLKEHQRLQPIFPNRK